MTRQDMRAAWSARSRREQRMLTGLAGLLAVLVLWYGLVAPAFSWREAAGDRLQAASMQSGRVQARLARLKATRDVARPASNLAADQAARQAAEAAGLDVQVTVTGEGDAVFTIASTPTGPLFAWLTLLETDYGLRPSRLTIARSAGGLQVEGALPVAG